VTKKIKSLFFLASVILLISLLFCGQSYAQSGSKITPRLLELYKQKLKGASAAPAYGENSKVYVLFTAATNTDAVDFSFFTERKIEYQKSEHFIEAIIDAELIPELDSIAGITEIDISIQATPAASAGNALMNVTDYNNNGIKGAGVKIGIVDIQYDGYQSRLPSSVISADFTKTGNPPIDNSGTGGSHGTSCAGIAYDIVPEAQMYIARISGTVSMENAYAWCFNNGVKIISISLSMGATQANTIVNNYTDKGILTVSAAGNSGPGANTIIIPATQEKVLTVGSIDLNNAANWTNGTLWNASSRGPGANGCIKPDLLAPSPGGYTSFAAPHAAGAAAILLSVANSSLCDTPAKLKALVVSFARPIGTAPDNNYGYGKLVLPNYSDFVGLVNGTISTITPTESRRGTNNVSVTINGTNFLSGSTAKLIKGTSTITAASVSYNSSSRLTATFNIPSAATVGYYDLAVSSIGYANDITKTGIFLVLGNSMAINNVTPDIGIRGTTLNLTATGTDFQSGAAIKLVSSGTVINGTVITRSGTTGITASFAISSGVANGTKFDLTVTNTNGDYVTKTQAVTVYNALTVTSFTPSNATVASAVSLTVTGTGFINGYSKIILKNASNESQTITPSTTSVSATQIAGTFTAPGSTGTWKVYVSAYNGGPEYAASSNLSITALPAGTISTITPTESKRGTNNVSVTINGTNLVAGSMAKLIKGTTTITANSVTYNSSSRLTATFNIPGSATVGYYDLAVSSSGYAGDITKTGIFLVLGNSMAINNVVPDIGIRGTTLNLTATGTDFQSGAAIKLVNGSTVINGTGVTRSTTTAITASFAIPSGVANGTKFDLTVTNTSGDYITRTQAVTVYSALTVTGFTPLSANTGSVLITVTGTGFINGYSKIILKNTSNTSQTITPNITSASAAQITGTFTATSSGTWKVYVRAYDNGPEYAAAGSMTIAASTAHNLFAYEGAEITFPVISKDGAISTGKMIIPERTFSEDVTVDVKQHGSLAPADSYVRELSHTNIGVIIDAQGKKPEREIELRIPYNNSDITGMNEESLVISRYDEEKQVWVPLKSKADSNNKQITAYLDHLSVFAIMGTATAVKAFDDVKYYPNPIQPSKGLNYSRMHFSNIPAGTRIKIYTMLGKAVRELEADASGMAVWDGKNNTGEKAASGVYIVYMEDSAGNKKRIKIAVER